MLFRKRNSRGQQEALLFFLFPCPCRAIQRNRNPKECRSD
uniref:Uncharacterized protein n=1 Tax=Anguilla anguilla TaxID=7936 RepID=A0A0E9Q5Q0_ANGAN